MLLLDIKDLKEKPLSAYVSPNLHRQHQQQYQFQLLMQQVLLKLPVEPILAAYPQLATWLSEVRSLLPSLFRVPANKLHLDIAYSHALNTTSYIQVSTNAVYKKQRIVLIDWAIRKAKPTWGDKVKLWVVSESLSIEPASLGLIILAVHRDRPANKLIIPWNLQEHNQTGRQVLKALKTSRQNSNQGVSSDAIGNANDNLLLPSIAEIDEVPI